MGFGEIDCRVARHVEPALLQSTRECLGVGHYPGLVLILEMVHLIGRQEEPQEGAEMVIGHTAGESPAPHGFPQLVAFLVFLEPA